MAAFVNSGLTQDGILVLAKGIAGSEIQFTRIVLGSGYMGEEDTIRNMTEVIEPAVTLPISGIRVLEPGSVVLTSIFHPSQLSTDFYYRELGVYATDPDTLKEVLYCYGNAGDEAEHIYPNGGAAGLVEKVIDVIVRVESAANVTAYIPSDACATRADYETYITNITNILNIVNIAVTKAEQAVLDADSIKQQILELIPAIRECEAKVNTLYDAILYDLTDNPFIVTFASLTKVRVISGVWNREMQRLEC